MIRAKPDCEAEKDKNALQLKHPHGSRNCSCRSPQGPSKQVRFIHSRTLFTNLHSGDILHVNPPPDIFPIPTNSRFVNDTTRYTRARYPVYERIRRS